MAVFLIDFAFSLDTLFIQQFLDHFRRWMDRFGKWGVYCVRWVILRLMLCLLWWHRLRFCICLDINRVRNKCMASLGRWVKLMYVTTGKDPSQDYATRDTDHAHVDLAGV